MFRGVGTMKKMLYKMLGMGLLMGIVFPIYADFFVSWIPERKMFFNIGCIFAGLMVGIVNYFISKQTLFNPVKKITTKAKIVSSGDLTQKIDIEGQDIIGELASSINSMIIVLNNLLRKTADIIEKAQNMSSELNIATGQTAAAQEQATGQTKNIVDNTHIQTNSLQTVNGYMQEILVQIKEVSASSELVKNITAETNNQINTGFSALKTVKESMFDFDYHLKDSGQIIELLSKRSKEISDTVTVIKEIANQTNMLSLNAAIESARAGEYGKGFAVVAGEVGNLAKTSNKSAEQVSLLAKAMQEDISKVIRFNHSWKELIARGIETVHRTENTFNEIAQSVNKISEFFRKMTDSLALVSENSNLTRDRMLNTSTQAEQNLALTRDILSAMQQQAACMEDVQSVYKMLSQEIDKLNELIKAFKY